MSFAQRRKATPVRVAVPVRRSLADIVPRWALALHTGAALGTLFPPVAKLRIDQLLRARSARVPVGLGTAALCALIGGGISSGPSIIILLAGLVFWSVVANPSSTPLPA